MAARCLKLGAVAAWKGVLSHMCVRMGAGAADRPAALTPGTPAPAWPLQVCCALAQIAKHSVDLAEVVVEAEVFPKLLTCLKVGTPLQRGGCGCGQREAQGAGVIEKCSLQSTPPAGSLGMHRGPRLVLTLTPLRSSLMSLCASTRQRWSARSRSTRLSWRSWWWPAAASALWWSEWGPQRQTNPASGPLSFGACWAHPGPRS